MMCSLRFNGTKFTRRACNGANTVKHILVEERWSFLISSHSLTMNLLLYSSYQVNSLNLLGPIYEGS